MPRRHASGRRRIAAAAAVLLCSVALGACADAATESSPSGDRAAESGDLLSAYDLDGLGAREVITRLDEMPVAERPAGLIASVRPDALVLTDERYGETRLAMPEEEFYLSIAPYRGQTHECHFHSLTTCLGELPDTEVRISLTDADGDVLVDERRRTFDNGFVGVWVPRDLEGATLRITGAGRAGEVPITTTGADDPTCITTLRLT